jgi:hypothetical protein
LAQASSLAHLVLERHVLCAEHGKWMHVERVRPQVRTDASRLDHPAVEPTSADQGGSHQHCQVLAEVRKLALATPSLEELRTIAVVCVDEHDHVATLIPRQRYSFAPKTSPPA